VSERNECDCCGRLEERVANMGIRIDELVEHVVTGNGTPSLLQRVTLLEGPVRTIGKLGWAMVAALLSLVVAILSGHIK